MKVSRRIRYVIMVILLPVLFSGCSQKEKSVKLLIATAANMQFAIKDIAEQFSEDSGIECELIVSSSGKLTAQILEGAPFDLLVSADMKYPEKIHSEGFSAEKPEIYAYGQLVIWTLTEDIEPLAESLSSDRVKNIAIANPETAPYGAAAVEALHSLDIYDQVEDKFVFGESISQTNQFIITQAAQLGFTSRSIVESINMKNTGRWTPIDPKSHNPIKQGVVVLKNENSEASLKFQHFLLSEKAQKILSSHGYLFKQ